MYDVLTKCIYKKADKASAEILNKYRQALLKDTSVISITDFGAGSRVFKSNDRKVNAIAKNAGITKKKQLLLYKITRYFQTAHQPTGEAQLLELGTSMGLATAALSLGNPMATIQTVEGCPATASVAGGYLKQFNLENIQLINAKFEDFFISEAFTKKQYDLVYIDGNHDKEKTLSYFSTLLPHTHNDSVLIFDDIYWSKSMTEAWQQISAHPQVTVSIDSFHWGLVFFRKEQNKEHFTLRL